MNSTSISSNVPQHVAIIMDGNGRWAQKRNQPRTFGHRKGAEAVERTLRAAEELGIKYLTLFAFSTENWKRPADEVGELMRLIRFYIQNKLTELHENNVRVKMIGDRTRLSPDLLKLIESAEVVTRNNTAITLQVALSYSGRWDLAQAAQKLAEQVKAGTLQPDQITEETLAAALDTDGIPEPDLLIRTSGEQRISNFMMWQLAYSECYFTPTLWPDFGKDDLVQALDAYTNRERRFGQIPTAPLSQVEEG